MNITVLPDDVANHIAAGEVIERPASVVKELVENAIDAGATQIDIEIGIGGKSYIRIRDNGHGMTRENAQRAFERHATSKITCTEDISNISTLGFRGEALPSIASVSKVKLLTQTADTVLGTRLEIHGGEFLHVQDSGATTGTYIEVNELFYKTPARLKFLKSPATEMSYINAVVSDQALANPHIGFTVKNNGKEQLHLPADSTLQQRIAGLFGRDIVRDMIEVHESAGSLGLRGFIGLPSCNRANRNYQKMIINGRPVKDKVVGHAIQQGFDTLIPKRRFPVVFLFLSIPVQLVDVNVHPTKTEVRFVNSQTIHDLVRRGIRSTLSSALNRSSLPSFTSSDHSRNLSDAPQRISLPSSPSQETSLSFLPERHESASAFRPSELVSSVSALKGAAPRFEHSRSRSQRISPAASLTSQDHLTQPIHAGPSTFSRMRPIGQFEETYILAQAGEELFIIDQHAAHERVFYEKLKKQFQERDIDIQQLLFPVSIELSHREQAVLEEHLNTLHDYGFELDPFGGTTYLLKAVPALLAKADYKKLLYDIIDQLGESQKAESIEHKLDEVFMVMACHAAIRAHQRLQDSQMIALLQQMDALDLPYTCPHGRPTVIKISLYDLEKKFGRVM
jgi:DNA mismatch repair protein MutL